LRRATLLILMLVLPASPLWAAEPAPPVPKGVEVHRNQTVDVSLEEADLRAVVTALARTFDINVVGSDKLGGKVTLNLRGVPVREALAVIVKNAGFELVEKEGGIYEILTPQEAAKAEAAKLVPALRIFELKYAEAPYVAERLVPNALPDKSHIAEDPSTGRLILRGTPSQLENAETIIQALDVPLPQVSIQARIVEIYTDRAKSMGVSLAVEGKSGQVGDNGAGEIKIDLAQAMQEVPTVKLKFLSDRVDALLNALEQKDVAEVLSAPTIATSHGQQAEFKVVNQVPYITRTTRVVDQVTVTDETITFKETGLTLTVTPRVLGDGRIQMLVEPSVLELTGFTDTDPPAPIIDTRSAKTDVTITDGKWLVIGGLMRYNERTLERGVPVLKDIPLLGWFFRTSQTKREKSNLVILVTATVLNDARIDAAADAVRQEIRENREEGLEGGPFPDPYPDPETPPEER
jgi:type IV pilus assembly protein PilQ